jgi:mannose-6-phosphate isomerase-like protein (cupin superfamily)
LAKNVISSRIETKKRADTVKAIDALNEARIKERLVRENKEMVKELPEDKRVLYIIVKGRIVSVCPSNYDFL